jgi:chromosome segregation ATPase
MTTLEAVSADVEETLTSLQEVVHTAQNARQEIQEAGESLSGSLTRTNEEIDRLADDVGAWKNAAIGGAERVVDLGHTAHAALEPFNAAIASLQNELHQESAAIASAVRQVSEQAQHFESDASTALQSFSTQLENVGHAFRQRIEQNATGIWDACEQTVAQFSHAIEEIHSQTDQFAQSMLASIQSAEQSLIAGIQQVAQDVEQHTITDHAQLIESATQENLGSVTQGEQQFVQACQEQCKQAVDQILEELRQRIDAVREQLVGTTERSASVRELTKPLTDQIDVLQDPLKSVMDNVKSIAHTVGVDI